MRRNRHAAHRNLQAQRPLHFDPIKIGERAFLQYGKVAALANLTRQTPQHGAPLGGAAIVAQHIEPEAREALANDVGAPARFAGEDARLLEQRKRAVQRRLGKLGRLNELGQGHRAPLTYQYFEYRKGFQRGGGLTRNLSGLGNE